MKIIQICNKRKTQYFSKTMYVRLGGKDGCCGRKKTDNCTQQKADRKIKFEA